MHAGQCVGKVGGVSASRLAANFANNSGVSNGIFGPGKKYHIQKVTTGDVTGDLGDISSLSGIRAGESADTSGIASSDHSGTDGEFRIDISTNSLTTLNIGVGISEGAVFAANHRVGY